MAGEDAGHDTRGACALQTATVLSLRKDLGRNDELTAGKWANQDGDITGALNEADDLLANRHNNGANVVFCDAHVEYGKQTNWMKAVPVARQRWNNDHQPHPETWH